jgi:hypothetical protein
MASDIQSAQDRSPRGVSLDDPPDSPPEQRKGNAKTSFGLGETARDPKIMALQGLVQINNGMQQVAAAFPQLGPLLGMLGAIVTRIQQAVPQAIMGQANTGSLGPSGMLTPPPGPMVGAPPGIGAQGGAPGAPTPLPAGMGM